MYNTTDPPQTVSGQCHGFGNGCGACVEACDKVETCGNDRDDDCNGVIDDGCSTRTCAGRSECSAGSVCCAAEL